MGAVLQYCKVVNTDLQNIKHCICSDLSKMGSLVSSCLEGEEQQSQQLTREQLDQFAKDEIARLEQNMKKEFAEMREVLLKRTNLRTKECGKARLKSLHPSIICSYF